MMTIALLLVAAGAVKAQPLVDGWKKIQTGAEGNLYDICCIDADHIWVCSQDGGLLKSSDGGETWVRKHTEEGFAMSRIQFANTDVGYAMGVSSPDHQNMVLLKTIDAGETWARVADTALDAVAVDFDEMRFGDWQLVGTDTLYFFEHHHELNCANLIRSTDGGHSFHNYWQELPYESNGERRGARAMGLYFEDNEGYCVYSTTTVEGDAVYPAIRAFRTTDYGQTWTRHPLWVDDEDETIDGQEYVTARIHAIDKSEARLFFHKGYFDTHDGFASPPAVVNLIYDDYNNYYPEWSGYSDIKFTDERHGCVTGLSTVIVKTKDDPYEPNGYACITNDGGQTWNSLTNGMEPDRQVFSVDGMDTTFYVTSEDGAVYKRCLINGPQEVMEGASPESVSVSPTLTDGVVTVSSKSVVELEVYNTLGQRVLTLQLCESTATIDLTDQPAGLYFINVADQEGRKCVKKIVKQ